MIFWFKRAILALLLIMIAGASTSTVWNVTDGPISSATWLLVTLSAIGNIIIIFYHYAVPPHPKFLMLPFRKFVIRTHIISGTVELMAALFTCFFAPSPRAAIVQALAALCFHIPSALAQTRSVFGSQLIMWPAYLFCIAAHAFCAFMLITHPTSLLWAVNTFLIFNIYVWCRIYFYVFDWLKLFPTMKYTISILAAGATVGPAVFGPSTILSLSAFIFVFAVFHRYFLSTDSAVYKDLAHEKARDSGIARDSTELWADERHQADNRRLAKQFFDGLDTDGDGILSSEEIRPALMNWNLPDSLITTLFRTRLQSNRIDFDEFLEKIWSIGTLRSNVSRQLETTSAMSDLDKAKLVFKHIDLDDNGTIEPHELELLLLEWGLPSGESNRYMQQADLDGDGKLSFDEFFHGMKPVWQFIFYDILRAETKEDSGEMVGRIVAAFKDSRKTEMLGRTLKVDLMKKVPFLANATDQLISDLAAALVTENIKSGSDLFREGEAGDRFYLIGSGSIRISKTNVALAGLGDGACFGEGALLSDEPRNATATAITDTTLYFLTRSSFDFVLGTVPEIRNSMKELHQLRGVDTMKRTIEEQLLKGAPLLANSDETLIKALAESLVRERFKPNETIFVEGSVGDKFYLIANGNIRVSRGSETIANLGAGGCLGEGALISRLPRSASAVATIDTTLFALNRNQFDLILEQFPKVKEAIIAIQLSRRV